MKKVLAILVVLALVCGAVFANDGAKETHQIKLKSNVGWEVPVFQLEYKTGGKANVEQTALTNDGATPAAYNSTTAKTYDENADEIEVADISKGAITVTFDAKLQNTAKQVADYQVTIKAYPFQAKSDGKDYEVNPSAVSVALVNNLKTALKGVEPKEALDVAADIDETSGIGSGSVGLHFNGTTCVAGVFANISVTYPKDETVDPNETANDYYYANIYMEVVSK